MRTQSAGCTSVGLVREANEDSYRIVPAHGLFIVADGMGAHAAGEVASRMAADTITRYLTDIGMPRSNDAAGGGDTSAARLVSAVQQANARIFEAAQSEPRWREMGTTVVAVQMLDDRAEIAHVGDSRVYRWRGGRFDLLTRDHTLAAEYPEQYSQFAKVLGEERLKSIVTRAVGIGKEVSADFQVETLFAGERYLLCSDGLTGMLGDEEIAEVVGGSDGDLNARCESLISEANKRGGRDNITVVLVEVLP